MPRKPRFDGTDVPQHLIQRGNNRQPCREDEPRMTRWVARVMTTAHWFDISAAKNDFDYSPSVSLDDGLARLAAWHRAQHG